MYAQQIYQSQGQSRLPVDAARLYMSPPPDNVLYMSQNHDISSTNMAASMQRMDFPQGQDPRLYASYNSGTNGSRPAYSNQGVIMPNDGRLYASTRNDREPGIFPVAPQQKFRSSEQSRRSRPAATDPNIYSSQNSEGRGSQRTFSAPGSARSDKVRERQLYSSQNSEGQGRMRAPAAGADARLYSSQSSDGSVKVASLQAAQFVQVITFLFFLRHPILASLAPSHPRITCAVLVC